PRSLPSGPPPRPQPATLPLHDALPICPNGYIWQVVNGGTQGPVEGDWWLGGMSGTSMASPHVAAAAALVQSVAEVPLDWEQMRRSEEHTSELQSRFDLVCRLLLAQKTK